MLITQISFLIATLALLCLGPSKLLNFSDNSTILTLIGLALLGVGASAAFVPLFAEIIEAI